MSKFPEIYFKRVVDTLAFHLDERSDRAIRAAVPVTRQIVVGDVVQLEGDDFRNIAGIGELSIARIRYALGHFGLRLGCYDPQWPPSDIEHQMAMHQDYY